MDEFKPVRVFLEVAAQKSFAAAARNLRLNPASVTRIVAGFEASLGQQLFVRTTRQVSLTSAGALVAARYRPLVEEFDRVTHEIAHAALHDRGSLRVNAPMSMGVRLLPPLIAAFRTAYPEIRLDLRLTDMLVDILEDSCDLAIRVSLPPTDKSTIWRKLCEIPRRAVAAPGFFARIPVPDDPVALRPEHCLSYSADGAPETWTFRKGATQRSVKAGSGLVSNNGDLLYGVAAAGGGIAVLPDFITQAGLDTGEVIPVLEDWQAPSLWLTLYYPPYEKLPPLVATFTDFFESRLRDLDGLRFDPPPS